MQYDHNGEVVLMWGWGNLTDQEPVFWPLKEIPQKGDVVATGWGPAVVMFREFRPFSQFSDEPKIIIWIKRSHD